MVARTKKGVPSAGEIVALLEEVATKLRAGDRSFGLQMPLHDIMRAMLTFQHTDGALLANRIGFQLLSAETTHVRYDIVQRRKNALIER